MAPARFFFLPRFRNRDGQGVMALAPGAVVRITRVSRGNNHTRGNSESKPCSPFSSPEKTGTFCVVPGKRLAPRPHSHIARTGATLALRKIKPDQGGIFERLNGGARQELLRASLFHPLVPDHVLAVLAGDR
jgi:hypothetical protein